MDEKYREMLESYKELKKLVNDQGSSEDDDAWSDVKNYLLENNSFENTLDEETAWDIIKEYQQIYLDAEGGWPLEVDRAFEVTGQKYYVIAWGASGSGEGKSALKGIVFVKD